MYSRFDILEAYYVFFVNYHEGQWSDKYKRLCKLRKYFLPRWRVREFGLEALSLDGKEIYDRLVAKETHCSVEK